MDELLKTIPGLGVGGALAVVVFYFYRQDRIDSIDRYARLFERLTEVTNNFRLVIQENTAAMQRNTDVIAHYHNVEERPN